MNSGAPIGTSQIQGAAAQYSVQRPLHQRPKSQWSIQSVRGKITGNCLWHACKALLLGIVLIIIGAAMATVGYYADSLSMEEEVQGNITVKVKNSTKGFHLSNLSYFGPVVMGFGGFVIVAACVMTFEARDNAAKIVPARFRSKPTSLHTESCGGGGATSNGTATYKSDCGEPWEKPSSALFYPSAAYCTENGIVVVEEEIIDRHALTSAFIQFSKNLQNSIDSGDCQVQNGALKRCPSAPTLMTEFHQQTLQNLLRLPNILNKNTTHHRQQCLLLNPNVKRLQVNLLQRQAVSVDNPGQYHSHFTCNMDDMRQRQSTPSDVDMDIGASASVHKTDSEGSMTMDLHLPDCSITLTVKDESKRSKSGSQAMEISSCTSSTVGTSSNVIFDQRNHKVTEVGRRETVKRHPLLRQKQVDHPDSDTEEPMSQS